MTIGTLFCGKVPKQCQRITLPMYPHQSPVGRRTFCQGLAFTATACRAPYGQGTSPSMGSSTSAGRQHASPSVGATGGPDNPGHWTHLPGDRDQKPPSIEHPASTGKGRRVPWPRRRETGATRLSWRLGGRRVAVDPCLDGARTANSHRRRPPKLGRLRRGSR